MAFTPYLGTFPYYCQRAGLVSLPRRGHKPGPRPSIPR